MATEKQKAAARRNLDKARAAQAARRQGKPAEPRWPGLSTHEENPSTRDENQLPENVFAFPRERKEPLTDASHVRNAVARFDQVEGVSDHERDEAWERIRSAARRYDVEVSAGDWHELMPGGHASQG
jgi:hypothetical protein